MWKHVLLCNRQIHKQLRGKVFLIQCRSRSRSQTPSTALVSGVHLRTAAGRVAEAGVHA
eukprot:SAG22_NODE_5376_length_1025_cov_2.205184_2_plen_58_part_01